MSERDPINKKQNWLTDITKYLTSAEFPYEVDRRGLPNIEDDKQVKNISEIKKNPDVINYKTMLQKLINIINETKISDDDLDKLVINNIPLIKAIKNVKFYNYNNDLYDKKLCIASAQIDMVSLNIMYKTGENEFNSNYEALNRSVEMGYKFIERLKEIENKSKEILNEAEQTRIKANTVYVEHALKGFKNLYNNESKKQHIESNKWFKWAKWTVTTLLTSILVCFAYNVSSNNSSVFIYANEITFNLVLLSIALWCARMYSINKALEINYMHKSVSADALMSYMEATSGNHETKNTILLESSRMIFAVPETGLTKSNSLDLKLLDTFRDISQVKQANIISEKKTNN